MRCTCTAIAVSIVVFGLSGCAPDAYTNREASGFNAFLNRIAGECRPLQLGPYPMSQMIERNDIDDNYTYFIDQTSRLY